MRRSLCLIMTGVLLTSCHLSEKSRNSPAREPGPCEGVNGFQEVRGNVVCHHGRVLSENAADFVTLGQGFAVDRKSGTVYSGGSRLEGADAATFEILNSAYSRDKARVYYSHQSIKGADPASFEILGSSYSRDKLGAYYEARLIAGADPASFEFVGHGFAKDKSHVYELGFVAPNIDAATFDKVEPRVATRFINPYQFFKDKDNVYYFKDKLSENYNMGIEVDPATFVYYGGPFMQVNRRVYFSFREPIDANPDTFSFLGCSFIRLEDPTNHDFALSSPPRRIVFCYGKDGERIIEKEY